MVKTSSLKRALLSCLLLAAMLAGAGCGGNADTCSATCDVNANCSMVTSPPSCVCNSGYTGNGQTCTAATCPALTIDNGSVAPVGAGSYRGTATYTCATGYALDGDATRTCQADGSWDGTAPTCTKATNGCDAKPCVHGTCTSTTAGGYSCACDSGWTHGNCDVAITCTSLTDPLDGHVTSQTDTPAGTATFTCLAGYTITGSATLTCGADGTWSAAAPTCTAHACPALTDPANGSVTPKSGATGDSATYSCNGGYTLTGDSTRTCGTDGTWSGAAPTCTQVTTGCTPNPCLHNGTCTVVGTGYTCTACDPGWSGANCDVPVTCSGATVPANGSVSASTATLGKSVTYSCDTGFSLSGSPTRTCQADGSFSGTAPTCVSNSCGTFTDVVYHVTGQFRIGDTTGGMGNATIAVPGTNASDPAFDCAGCTTPFVPTTFTNGFVRLRFTNDASGKPEAGTVSLVELYFPLEYTQTKGATIAINTDDSVGLVAPGIASCGTDSGGTNDCATVTPTLKRTCAANAQGTLSGTTLTWGACAPAPDKKTDWDYTKASASTGAGCATNWTSWGHAGPCSAGLCSFVPKCSLGDAYQTWNQQLGTLTFSGADVSTATISSMAEVQLPNCTGSSTTWFAIAGSTLVKAQCGSTPGTDLVCDTE